MRSLAEQLAGHPKWRWHIGMVAESTRVYDVGKSFAGYEVPDIYHPSTMGWLMVEIWKINHKAHTYCNAGVWSVLFTDAEGATPGDAIASALLNLWGPAQ